MKELKVEQKAKAYDEALEKAKKYHQQLLDEDNPEWASAIEELFPELAEPDDERIRKAIIAYFKCRDENSTYAFVLKENILKWLEKQGEQRANKERTCRQPEEKCNNMTNNIIKEVADLVTENTIFCTKEVLTSDEAAKYLGMSKSYLYKLTSWQKIPHFKPLGKMCYFNRQELEAWLQSNRVATETELKKQEK